MGHQRVAEWALLKANLPGQQPLAIGVFVRDPIDDQLYCRFAPKWWHSRDIDDDDCEYFEALMEDLQTKAQSDGGSLLSVLESATHCISITELQHLPVMDCMEAIELLYSKHVESLCNRIPGDTNQSEAPNPSRLSIKSLSWASGLAIAAGILCATLYSARTLEHLERPAAVPRALVLSRQPFLSNAHEAFLTVTFDLLSPQSQKRNAVRVRSRLKKLRFALVADELVVRPNQMRLTAFPQAPSFEYTALASPIPESFFEPAAPPAFHAKRSIVRVFRTLAKPFLWIVQ
jgi:hypothetical protein